MTLTLSMVANRHGPPAQAAFRKEACNMQDVVNSPIHMFAYDTKIYQRMTAQSGQGTLQTDLRQLEARTRKWQLRFNEEKCKVMHLGQYNHHYDYTIASGGTNITLGGDHK